MNCPRCKTRLDRGARFCQQCGLQVEANDSHAEEVKGTPRRLARGRGGDEDETLLWRGTFSFKGLIGSWLLAILISLVLPIGAVVVRASSTQWLVLLAVMAVVWLGLLALLGYHKLNVRYELTDQRLIHRSGILRRHTDRIELIDVDDVSHEQGLIERLFNVGTILLASSDRTHPVMELTGIDNVEQVASLIDDARRAERIRRGIHVEAI
jgi:membrane protein YdbS with pleckstrin-like domain